MSRPENIAAMRLRLVHAQQLGHDVTEGLVTVVGAVRRDLRHGVVQHPGTDRMPFGVVGVQEALR